MSKLLKQMYIIKKLMLANKGWLPFFDSFDAFKNTFF